MNITEDYCSYEVAKLLKEKGFDEQTVRCYNLKKELCACQCNGNETINSTPNYLIAAPTYQMTMKWLREVHKQLINVWYDGDIWSSEIYRTVEEDFCLVGHFQSYEEACEAAIKYCLTNLI